VEDRRELRLVACLFLDVVGSTEITVRLGPERMQRLLAEAFAELSGTVKRHGGIVEKYVGDAILAIFGVPTAHSDDTERALRAAVDAVAWATARASSGGLGVRAGIETGELLVDEKALETQQRMLIGASINLAARLQSLAEPGQVIVGPGAHEATAAIADYASLGDVELKGLGTVEAWRLTGLRETGLPSDIGFVGREPELAQLAMVFDRARHGEPALAVLVGPPGQGKTRLAREALRRAGDLRALSARCQQEPGENSPLRQLVAAEAGVASAEVVRERIAELLASSEAAEVAAAVNHSAGLAIDDHLLGMSRYEQRELIARQWQRYLAAAATDQPVCLFVEDVHWADPLLLRVLDYVTAAGTGNVVGLATARPEFMGTAHFRPGEHRIDIEVGPLDANASAKLAELASGGSADVAASVERAAGHPLFLIELARVRRDVAHTPVTVQAAIAARLDELSAEDRQLVQVASVAGDCFDIRDAAVLADREPGDIVPAFARVAQLAFIAPDGACYRFQHALIRDVVYGRLPVVERMALHARYAVEGVDRADVVAQAYHWWQALRPPDAEWVWAEPERRAAMRSTAFQIHLAAAARLEERNAHEEALDVAKRALELTDGAADRAHAEAVVGRLYARQAKGDESWAHRTRALELYAEAGEVAPASVYAEMLEIAAFNWGYFHTTPGRADVMRLLDEGEQVARSSGADAPLALLLAERASYTEQPPSPEAIRALLDGDPTVAVADGVQRIGTTLLWAGRIAEALAVFDAVFERLLPSGAIFNIDEALLWRGLTCYVAGDLERATAISKESRATTAHRSVHTRTHSLGLDELISFGRGDWAALRATHADLRTLIDLHPESSLCLVTSSGIGFSTAADLLAGSPLPADLDAQVLRAVTQSPHIRAASVMLPRVMLGDGDALAPGLEAYASGLPLGDRMRVWDPTGIVPAIAMTMLERWDDLNPVLDRLDLTAANGGRMPGAVAAAVREERSAAADGAGAPRHEALRELGYLGLSELLRYRAPRRG
jgi:class 3 adenylate cyclase/tetratricopeptide (TPR) repeat protein